MDFANVRADMLPELFEQAKATPRRLLAFRSADGIRFEAGLCTNDKIVMTVWARAEEFDDDIRCDYESGEDWVRKALEGSGLEFVHETPTTYGTNHWEFSCVRSESFYGVLCGDKWGDESAFWDAAIEELKRAQATHACKCGKALTINDECPVCWVSSRAEPVCPDAPMKKRPKRA